MMLEASWESIEQSHWGIKQGYYPTLRFGVFESAKRFYQAFDEARQFLGSRTRMVEVVSLSEQRKRFVERIDELQKLFYVSN